MPGDLKHYAGRWICQARADQCKGVFRVYGENRPCPLAGKCRASPYRAGQLEHVYLQNKFQKLMLSSEPDWNMKHAARRNEAKAAFDRDAVSDYFRDYRARNREKINERFRTKYDPSLETLFPGRQPGNAFKEQPPPCGGDCRNCPYDEGCRYPDWDAMLDKKREAKREGRQRYAVKRRERMAADPEYAERERAKARNYTRAYRQRKKALMGVKRKDEGPPAPRVRRPRKEQS